MDWELLTLNDQGQSNNVPVSEMGLGTYRATIALQENSELTVRLRDPDSDKLRILHFDRPFPLEYQLTSKIPVSIEQLSPIEAAKIRDSINPISTRKSIAHWFYLSAIGCLLIGTLVRRL